MLYTQLYNYIYIDITRYLSLINPSGLLGILQKIRLTIPSFCLLRLIRFQKLDQPIFTPTTKAEVGPAWNEKLEVGNSREF